MKKTTSTTPATPSNPIRTLRTLDDTDLRRAIGGGRVCIMDSRGRCHWRYI